MKDVEEKALTAAAIALFTNSADGSLDVSDASAARDAAAMAIAAYEAALWQPIEKAPKDGTVILTLWDGGVRQARYLDNSLTLRPWQGFVTTDRDPFSGRPTHWRPMPTLPAVDKDAGNG